MRIRDKDTIKKEIISLLPHQPGVYRFFDSDGKIIYVGKAKDLKKRVSSYFVSENRLNAKTQVLVSKIADVKFTVVENEQDAFLLENNLIKENQPRYNILLKDSKTYPWICIKKEPFPRIFITRTLTRDGSLYFGPYSSAMYAHSLVDMFHSMFRLRTCSLKLNKEDIAAGIIKMVLQSIGSAAWLASLGSDIRDFVLIGNLSLLPQCKEVFPALEKLYDIRFHIPKYSQYCTAIGAALDYTINGKKE